jgi:hypothetical protein
MGSLSLYPSYTPPLLRVETTRFPGNGKHTRLLTAMDRFCLQVICASILLLVTAFALGMPGLKSEGPPEKALLLRVATR